MNLFLQLTQAQEGVNSELERLDSAAVRCIEQVNSTFQQVSAALESRRLEMVAAVNSSCQEKRRVLEEQQALIDAEKSKVCVSLHIYFKSNLLCSSFRIF